MGILLTVLAYVYFQPTTPYVSSTESGQSNSGQTSASSESINPSSTGTTGTTTDTTASTSSSKISLATLAEHNSEQDCWVGYQGKAYDVTSFLPNHPGGVRAIARNCGTSTQFEDAFRKQHGTSKASLFIKVAIYKGDLQ